MCLSGRDTRYPSSSEITGEAEAAVGCQSQLPDTLRILAEHVSVSRHASAFSLTTWFGVFLFQSWKFLTRAPLSDSEVASILSPPVATQPQQDTFSKTRSHSEHVFLAKWYKPGISASGPGSRARLKENKRKSERRRERLAIGVFFFFACLRL